MSNWLFTWKGIVPGVVILLGALAFGIAFREGPLGNVASIVGLAVSVLGFVVTIWTVRDAGQQIQEASERSQKAIQQVREEARRTLEGIATQFLNVNCASLHSGVDALHRPPRMPTGQGQSTAVRNVATLPTDWRRITI